MHFRPITLLVVLFAMSLGGGLAIRSNRFLVVMQSRPGRISKIVEMETPSRRSSS